MSTWVPLIVATNDSALLTLCTARAPLPAHKYNAVPLARRIPDEGATSPAASRSSVLLPDPFAPVTTQQAAASSCSESGANASVSP